MLRSRKISAIIVTSLCFIVGFMPVNLQAQEVVAIWEIQGKGNISSYDQVEIYTTENIVTAVGNSLFFIQSTPKNADLDPLTSEGLVVLAENNINLPQVGDLVNVSGMLLEQSGNTSLLLEQLEIVSSSSSSPEAINLSDNFPSGENKSVHDLESVENALVDFEDIWIASPSDSEGRLIVSAKTQRPEREAGVEYPAPNGFLEWDGNNERIGLIPHALGGPRELNVFSGSKISGKGIIVQAGSIYQLWPIEYEIEERTFETLPARKDTELTIACMNVLRFYNFEFNYPKRLHKLSKHIVEVLGGPDIMAFQEMGGKSEMDDIRDAILALDPTMEYKVWIFESGADIYNAYLTRKTISKIEAEQLGVFETLTVGGRKHDRPPLLLKAEVNTPERQNISILNLHMRSLNGIEGNSSTFVRTKRHEQAISVTEMVKSLQVQNRNIIVLGDFNAFQFSDGYVDIVNQIRGSSSLGAAFEIETSILETPLRNISEEFTAPEERYSYVFNGNIQMIDHCLVGELDGMKVSDFHFSRGNADSPELNLVNDSNGFRISDHDGFMLYLDVGAVPEEQEILPDIEIEIAYPNPFQSGDFIRLNLEEKNNLQINLYSVSGVLVENFQLIAFDQGTIELESVSSIPAGVYFLSIEGRSFNHLGKVFVVR